MISYGTSEEREEFIFSPLSCFLQLSQQSPHLQLWSTLVFNACCVLMYTKIWFINIKFLIFQQPSPVCLITCEPSSGDPTSAPEGTSQGASTCKTPGAGLWSPTPTSPSAYRTTAVARGGWWESLALKWSHAKMVSKLFMNKTFPQLWGQGWPAGPGPAIPQLPQLPSGIQENGSALLCTSKLTNILTDNAWSHHLFQHSGRIHVWQPLQQK